MAFDNREDVSKLDDVLLAALPGGGEVIATAKLGLSDWCETTRIDVRMPDGDIQQFFEKSAIGMGGLDLVTAHWESESSVYKFIPEFMPKPVAMGTYKSRPDTHFFLMEYVEMIDDDDIPHAEAYMAPIIALHNRSMGQSPNGKFGFHVKNWFGDLPQSNEWNDSWEAWWTSHMQMVFDRDEQIRGPHDDEGAELVSGFISKVLPRYLRPLETGGRSITPCLIHWDLWPGNVKYRPDNETAVIYDANCIWAHNEADLAPIRNPRYPLGKPYLKEYRSQVWVSQPEEDLDSRLMMYMIRNQICISSLYPEDAKLRDIYLSTARLLLDRIAEEEADGKLVSLESLEPLDVPTPDIMSRVELRAPTEASS